MSLQLNGPDEPVDGYKEFYGPNNKQMPLLIADGGISLSAAGLMKRRVEVLEMLLSAARGVKYERFSDLAKNPETAPFYELLVAWFGNYIDTGDGAPGHSDGRMKVATAAQYVRDLTSGTKLVGGAVHLTDQDYAGLAGVELSKAEVDRYCGKPLSISDVKRNPVWLALAGGDKALLSEFADVSAFVDAAAAQAKGRLNYDGKVMGVHAPPIPGKEAVGHLWTVGRVDGSIDYSGAFGDLHLGSNLGRLVRVVPEAQRTALEQRL